MPCDHCKLAERECDCGDGPCPDCYTAIFGEEESPTEQQATFEAINKDVNAFLRAHPGTKALLVESPGALEVTPVPVVYESIYTCASSTPTCRWTSSAPTVQNIEGTGTPTGEHALVVADAYGADVRLLRSWDDKSVKAPASPYAGLGLSVVDRLILLLSKINEDPASPAFRAAVEREAGPCEIKVIGGSIVQITRLTPNPDGTRLEMQIEY